MDKQICIKTIEMHSCGHGLRIIVSGYPEIKGITYLEKLEYCKREVDYLRKLIILEPRGHQGLMGLMLVEPDDKRAQVGLLVMDNAGYVSMCGDAVITISKYVIDKGIIENPSSPEMSIGIQLPCGLVESKVEYNNGKTGRVRFQSVPAFALKLDVTVPVAGYGDVTVDIGYGGTFWAIVPAQRFELEASNTNTAILTEVAMKVKEAVIANVEIEHPERSDFSTLYGVILTDGMDNLSAVCNTHIVVCADRQVVRSPCGSATTARVAVQYARHLIITGQCRSFMSGISQCIFTAEVKQQTTCGHHDAVVVEISGSGSHYTGESTFTLEDDDEFPEGLIVK